jgi:hypothetical protein
MTDEDVFLRAKDHEGTMLQWATQSVRFAALSSDDKVRALGSSPTNSISQNWKATVSSSGTNLWLSTKSNTRLVRQILALLKNSSE